MSSEKNHQNLRLALVLLSIVVVLFLGFVFRWSFL
ncbi:MAG: cytochrome oxidase small assembly protein [Betaproteobacteria bacterium]|nr:cytochrome oxidase small assembly protein [Betaproteobacteria bacterium]MDE2124181.1 cytochrome oxidase small assembly protein [Betaproteobacteria bacterium]MDE2186922.1 cytochrome oxidase small assembly protein [Betaproteobacteria bacterium]MDE2323119.1 cytochrome oxidase small assembly protein [Betaproteobacteria bacterium]